MTREEAYDEFINPLMAQILLVCEQHKIPMLASFGLASEEDEGLCCTSAMLDKEWNPPEEFLAAFDHVKPKPPPKMLMITTRDKDGKVINVTGIAG